MSSLDDRIARHDAAPAPGAGHALVLGDLDITGPLREHGTPVTLMRRRDEPSRFSRSGVRWTEQPTLEQLPAALVAAARELPGPVVLYVAEDVTLRVVSQHRDRLRKDLSFVLPEPDVVDTLLDKGRFQDLALRRGLPVPDGMVITTAEDIAATDRLDLPVLIKPLDWREETIETDFGGAKAAVATTRSEARALLDRVADAGQRVLVQHFIPGAETAVESYHVYVDADGRIAAEFTGRKIRTHPAEFGYSTALTTTDEQDVIDLGRQVVRAVGLVGVAKVDFKRDATGKLWVFEVNARFNLWHRLGAAAGCNIPALVFSDLTGRPRPEFTRGRSGLTWSRQPRDLLTAHEQGMPLSDYLRWLRQCDVVSGLRISDPMPFLRGSVPIQARAGMLRARHRRQPPV